VDQNRRHTLDEIGIHGVGSVNINDAANSTHSFGSAAIYANYANIKCGLPESSRMRISSP
jgi:hypothetical protein